MAIDLEKLLADLAEETKVLDDILADVPAADWELPTPAAGWAIRDQVSHLAYFDTAATMSAVEPEKFRTEAAELLAIGAEFPDVVAARYREMPTAELFAWFRGERAALLSAFAELPPKARVPWYGPDMSVASSATARLMETWAHGQDIADTLAVQRKPTNRLRNIAHLGVSTFGFTYALNGREIPVTPVHVELSAPEGDTWSWGPEDAAERVTGTALDFCLVVTQRRNIVDTGLRVTGAVATEWISIAQAFAGAPGPGRAPLKEAQ